MDLSAALGGGKGELKAYLSNSAAQIASTTQANPDWVKSKPNPRTPFVTLPGLLSGQCVSKDGFNDLEATVNADPADPRTDTIPGDVAQGGVIAKDWGLHLIDANIAMGNLVDIVGAQSKAYLARRWGGRSTRPRAAVGEGGQLRGGRIDPIKAELHLAGMTFTRSPAPVIALLGALSLCASSAKGAEPGLAAGFSGALKGCEEWVFNPKSWIDGPAPFIASTGLGDSITSLSKVGDFALPPPQLRQANHYWRIDATPAAGFVLATSDRLPMCHITGAGQGDFHTAVVAVLAESTFHARWEKIGEQVSGDLTSTNFRSRAKPAFSLVVSRATKAGQREGGVQLVATAQLDVAR